MKVVIIGGVSRSGTTLMRRFLDSHPDVAVVPKELGIGRAFRSDLDAQSVLEALPLAKWGLDPSVLGDIGPQDHGRLYRRVLRAYAAQQGAKVAGEKTPENEFSWPELRTWFEGHDLYFVHMVRRPVDVIASHSRAPYLADGQKIDVEHQARIWRRSARLAVQQSVGSPRRYAVVRYEDLTSRPAQTAQRLCHFLHLREAVSDMCTLSAHSEEAANSSFVDPTGQRGITRAQDRGGVLSADDLEVIDQITSGAALAFGYRRETGKARETAEQRSLSGGRARTVSSATRSA